MKSLKSTLILALGLSLSFSVMATTSDMKTPEAKMTYEQSPCVSQKAKSCEERRMKKRCKSSDQAKNDRCMKRISKRCHKRAIKKCQRSARRAREEGQN